MVYILTLSGAFGAVISCKSLARKRLRLWTMQSL